MKSLLKKIVSGKVLDETETFALVEAMAQEPITPCAGAVLAALAMRGESASELAGCVRYLRENMVEVPVHAPCADIVGTGGDGLRTFNISTAAAFVASAVGVPVTKHGNRAVSSSCGAADVLETLGIRLEKNPVALAEKEKRCGFAFLFARELHPALGKIAPLRRELGIRTIFNLAGPLVNPAKAEFMVAGVYADRLLDVFAEVLRQTGTRRALVVHSCDGMDEISSLADTEMVELASGKMRRTIVRPQTLLAPEECRGTLAGGSPAENSRILLGVLSGRDHTAKRGAVLLNAAALIMVFGIARDLSEGVALAGRAIDSGAAMAKLEEVRQ